MFDAFAARNDLGVQVLTRELIAIDALPRAPARIPPDDPSSGCGRCSPSATTRSRCVVAVSMVRARAVTETRAPDGPSGLTRCVGWRALPRAGAGSCCIRSGGRHLVGRSPSCAAAAPRPGARGRARRRASTRVARGACHSARHALGSCRAAPSSRRLLRSAAVGARRALWRTFSTSSQAGSTLPRRRPRRTSASGERAPTGG